MASINGISVKSLKAFEGHEGEVCYQGNVYLGNKKLGMWSQDSWGGPDRFDFESRDMEKRLNKKVIELNQDKAMHGTTRDGKPYTVDYDLELLMYDLVKLQLDEKEFKNSIKKGNAGLLIVTDGYHKVVWNLREAHTKMSNDKLLRYCYKMIEDAKAEAKFYKENEWTKHEVKVYRSLDDFKIGEPITMKDISKDSKTVDEKMAKAKGSKGTKTVVKKGNEQER